MQVDLIVAFRSEALQLNETLRLAQLDKTEGEGQLQILKDKIAAKNLEGERSALTASPCMISTCHCAWLHSLRYREREGWVGGWNRGRCMWGIT